MGKPIDTVAGSHRIKRGIIHILPALLCALVFRPSFAQRRIVKVRIRMEDAGDSVRVRTAALRYGKDFAFSFTLDDGLVSAYLVAFPFFSGGRVAAKRTGPWGGDQGADGRIYPGLFYSDGCGHAEPFRAAIAINGKSIRGEDSAVSSGWLTWKQVKELYDAGWDVLNHSYGHITGRDVDAAFQVSHNNEVVQDHTGIVMKDFVIPGGRDDRLSDEPYAHAAFSLGMETVQCEHFGRGMLMCVPDSGPHAEGLKLGRYFLHTSTGRITGDSVLSADIVSKLRSGHKFWVNAFTHAVGNSNLWHISLVFPEFAAFFQQLAKRYGQKGADNMWMAPTQEVYEYLLTRRLTTCSVRRKGKHILVKINTERVPPGLRRHELTLILEGARIGKAKGKGCHVESYGGTGTRQFVNLDW